MLFTVASKRTPTLVHTRSLVMRPQLFKTLPNVIITKMYADLFVKIISSNILSVFQLFCSKNEIKISLLHPCVSKNAPVIFVCKI